MQVAGAQDLQFPSERLESWWVVSKSEGWEK